jgi:hypothetical protein
VFLGGGFDQFVNHVNIHSLHFNIIGKAFCLFEKKKKIHALHLHVYMGVKCEETRCTRNFKYVGFLMLL